MNRKHKNRQPSVRSNLPEQQQQAQRVAEVVRQTLQVTSFSGPLPPPDQLEHYERIAPGIAERIVAMAEQHVSMADRQMQHRHGLENRVVDSNIKLAKRGQIFAYSLGVIGLGGGMFLIHAGLELWGGTAFLGSLASLIAVFIYGQKKQEKELTEKRGLMEVPSQKPRQN